MEMRCEIAEESCDDLFCGDWLKWKDEVCEQVWQFDADGVCFINEQARHDEIEKRAYYIWEQTGGCPDDNWLRAEIEVDMALFD